MSDRKRVNPDSVPQIARRMRLLRMATAESQADFCRRFGFNRQTWNTYEAGHRINVDAAMMLFRKLGVPLDWTYMGVEAMLPSWLAAKIHEIEKADE